MARIVFTLEDGTEIETELDSDVITLGRHPDSHVVLPSISVSSHHATIKRRGGDFFLQDLGTTNGTKLNGVDVEEAKLSNGDRVTLGDVPSVVYLTNAPAAKPVAKPSSGKPLTASGPVIAKVATSAVRVGGAIPRAPGFQAGAQRPLQYKDGTGCASFLMLLIFLTLAFVAGLCLRHYNDTNGGFLPMDLYKKIQQGDAAEKEKKAAPAKAGKNASAP